MSKELIDQLRYIEYRKQLDEANFVIKSKTAEIERLTNLNGELLTALEGASAKMVSAWQCHPLAMPVLLGDAHEIIDIAIASAKGQS